MTLDEKVREATLDKWPALVSLIPNKNNTSPGAPKNEFIISNEHPWLLRLYKADKKSVSIALYRAVSNQELFKYGRVNVITNGKSSPLLKSDFLWEYVVPDKEDINNKFVIQRLMYDSTQSVIEDSQDFQWTLKDLMNEIEEVFKAYENNEKEFPSNQ